MGTNNLPIITASTVLVSHVNDIITALKGDFVGRNSSTGSTQAGQSLGTVTIPWGPIYGDSLNIAGNPINFDFIAAAPNRTVSGQTRTTSALADFIRADGTALTAVIEAATTDLVVVVNGTEVIFTTDVSLTGLTAAPSTNNTALVNEPSYADESYTKYAGEQKNVLNIDTAGTEWTSRVGQIIAFEVGGTGEIAMGYLKSATEIINCYRGFFFNSAGTPLVRQTIADNDVLTLLNLGWVYADNTGTTGAVGYITPTISGKEPTSPASGDYWYDLNSNEWFIYSGSAFISANRTLIGLVVNNTSACIASRSFDVDAGYADTINLDLAVESVTQVRSNNLTPIVNVYGTKFDFGYDPFVWDITADRDTGIAETASTVYYLYITETAEPKITTEKPYDRKDLRGFYHPYESWRYVGGIYNNSSNDFETAVASGENNKPFRIIFTASTGWQLPLGKDELYVALVGGGGGGCGNDSVGTSGGTSSFGVRVSATGGGGGTFGAPPAGAAGTGIGGDENYSGTAGVDNSIRNTGGDAPKIDWTLPQGFGGAFFTDGSDYGGGGGTITETGIRISGGGGGGAVKRVVGLFEGYVDIIVGAGGIGGLGLGDGGDGGEGVVVVWSV